MYQLTNVTKRFPRGGTEIVALDDVTLTVADGDYVVVKGPTGGGKSTLLQLLGGLDRPSDGQVLLAGQDLASLRERALCAVRARSIGFVFQGFHLIPTLTARENVETALVPLGASAARRRRRAAEALESVGLADRAGHLPAQLSGGQQQRVAIARALVKEPAVLLADEPTGNLDEQTRDEVLALLEGVWRDRGQTIVLVTHDSAIVRRASRVLSLTRGRVSVVRGPADPRPDRTPSPAPEPPRSGAATATSAPAPDGELATAPESAPDPESGQSRPSRNA